VADLSGRIRHHQARSGSIEQGRARKKVKKLLTSFCPRKIEVPAKHANCAKMQWTVDGGPFSESFPAAPLRRCASRLNSEL
jgi:hypothetical protein